MEAVVGRFRNGHGGAVGDFNRLAGFSAGKGEVFFHRLAVLGVGDAEGELRGDGAVLEKLRQGQFPVGVVVFHLRVSRPGRSGGSRPHRGG